MKNPLDTKAHWDLGNIYIYRDINQSIDLTYITLDSTRFTDFSILEGERTLSKPIPQGAIPESPTFYVRIEAVKLEHLLLPINGEGRGGFKQNPDVIFHERIAETMWKLIMNGDVQVTYLILNNISLVGRSLQACMATMNTYTHLTSLDISGNSLTHSVSSLLQCLQTNTTLTQVCLRRCDLTSLHVNEFANMLTHNSALKALYLCENRLGPDCSPIFRALEATNTTLGLISLEDNGITDTSLNALKAMIKTNTSLGTLLLNTNKLDWFEISQALEYNQYIHNCRTDAVNSTMRSIRRLMDRNTNYQGLSISVLAVVPIVHWLGRQTPEGNVTSQMAMTTTSQMAMTTTTTSTTTNVNLLSQLPIELLRDLHSMLKQAPLRVV
jgi:hypothetical protein